MTPTSGVTELYPFEGHFLDLDGIGLHYLDEGAGEPVLMVHGNPTWSFYYRRLVAALSPDYRCVAPDHVGCGRSDKPTDARYDYTLSRRVDDLGRLADHLELDGVTLVVHDWGGMIGLAWAVRNPDRVRRLVVLNTAAFGLPEGKPFPAALTLARLPVFGALLVRGLNAFSRGAVRTCVRREPMPKDVAAGYLEPYDSWGARIAVHRFVQDIPLGPSDRAWDYVRETTAGLDRLAHAPTLVCWGMQDFVFDAHFLAEWERHFPHAEIHRFEDAGHYVLEDAADDIIPLVRDFLARHGTEAAA